jgi:hypothetical protein
MLYKTLSILLISFNEFYSLALNHFHLRSSGNFSREVRDIEKILVFNPQVGCFSCLYLSVSVISGNMIDMISSSSRLSALSLYVKGINSLDKNTTVEYLYCYYNVLTKRMLQLSKCHTLMRLCNKYYNNSTTTP